MTKKPRTLGFSPERRVPLSHDLAEVMQNALLHHHGTASRQPTYDHGRWTIDTRVNQTTLVIMNPQNEAPAESTHDPQHHVRNIQKMLDEVLNHCREDSAKVDEPKAQALFETTAEVLLGLRTAYEHYATRAEPAMTPQKQQQR